GTSFGTIPVIAAIFVPLGTSLGFSALAITSLIGTAGAIGDAGSPASDSTLGPTSGLNVDGQHHHIWATCVPTFLHYNIPLFIFGLVSAMIVYRSMKTINRWGKDRRLENRSVFAGGASIGVESSLCGRPLSKRHLL